MNRSGYQIQLGVMVVVGLALPLPRAHAQMRGTAANPSNYLACDRCDLEEMWEDYKRDAKRSCELAEEASGKFGEAADNYGGALSDAQGLAEGLLPSLPTDLEGCVDAVTGKLGTAMTALSGLWKLGLASGAERDAADLMIKSDAAWKSALRAQACIKECCQARDKAPSLVQENPDIDFKQMVERGELRQCLERMSESSRKSLVADANAGKLDGSMHRDNVAAIKSLVESSGALKK